MLTGCEIIDSVSVEHVAAAAAVKVEGVFAALGQHVFRQRLHVYPGGGSASSVRDNHQILKRSDLSDGGSGVSAEGQARLEAQ